MMKNWNKGKGSKNILLWLEDWYRSQCDGEWEHEYGIKIGTLDNPGWDIEIDLSYTELKDIIFDMNTVERNESDWYFFRIKDAKFTAAGDPQKLEFLLKKFKEIVESHSKENMI